MTYSDSFDYPPPGNWHPVLLQPMTSTLKQFAKRFVPPGRRHSFFKGYRDCAHEANVDLGLLATPWKKAR